MFQLKLFSSRTTRIHAVIELEFETSYWRGYGAMGINWDSGLLYWKDHAPSATEHYTLSHLHPFVQRIEFAATDKHPTFSVRLYVSFGLHTFTRAIGAHDGDHEIYRDNRSADLLSSEVSAIVRATEHHPHAGEAALRVRTWYERSGELRHHEYNGW
jgi:hypothetical protein